MKLEINKGHVGRVGRQASERGRVKLGLLAQREVNVEFHLEWRAKKGEIEVGRRLPTQWMPSGGKRRREMRKRSERINYQVDCQSSTSVERRLFKQLVPIGEKKSCVMDERHLED